MANTCHNLVNITASKRSLDALEKAIKDKGGELGEALEALLPPPAGMPYDDGLEHFTEFADALNGNNARQYSTEYHWRLANYGTKSIYEGGSLDRMNDKLAILKYETTWSPNLDYWFNLIKAIPRFLDFEIKHQYFEDGIGYIGECLTNKVVMDNHQQDITVEHWKKAGAIVLNNEILWHESEVDLFDAFPI
jgi:hypothetical protein